MDMHVVYAQLESAWKEADRIERLYEGIPDQWIDIRMGAEEETPREAIITARAAFWNAHEIMMEWIEANAPGVHPGNFFDPICFLPLRVYARLEIPITLRTPRRIPARWYK